MVIPLWYQRNTVWYSDNEPCGVFQYGYAFLSCLFSCGNCWVHHVWVHEVFQRALHGCKHKHQQPPNSVLQKSDTLYATEDWPDNETFTLDDFDSLSPEEPAAQGDPDVLGYSQLGGAPLGISQQQTPQPSLRPERQVRSPDRHTYSEGYVRAQQRAKRVRRPRGG